MEDESLLGKILPVLQENKIAVSLGGIGLLSLGYGLIASSPQVSQPEIIIQEEIREEDAGGLIVVDVSGAVTKPGVYELESDARMRDVVRVSGGIKEDADQAYIAKNINLAQKVNDGEKVYIPFANEQVLAGNSSSTQAQGKISINSSDLSTLETLPGVGPVTAGKIISNRPYQSLEDLVTKKSVGQSLFDKIKDQISM